MSGQSSFNGCGISGLGSNGDPVHSNLPFSCSGENEFYSAALSYQQRGWRVVPVARAELGNKDTGKIPTVKDWPNYIASDFNLQVHWNIEKPYNIAILLGRDSKLVSLEFDKSAAFEKWKKQNPGISELTLIVQRDNAEPGRCHVYFFLADGQAAPKSENKSQTEGWEVRSDGCLNVVPPSRHWTGGVYKVLQDKQPIQWRDEYHPAFFVRNTRSRGCEDSSDGALRQRLGDAELARECLRRLNPKRADDYTPWIHVGMALENSGCDLQDWISWSRQSNKFEEGVCEEKWKSFEKEYKGEKLTVKSLVYWAREDDPAWRPGFSGGCGGEYEAGSLHLQCSILNVLQSKGEVCEKNKHIANSILEFLKKRGKLYFNSERKDFESCMYFDSVRKTLGMIMSDSFQSWLALVAGINRAQPLFDFIMNAILDESLSGRDAKGIVPDMFWACRMAAVYVSCGGGRMCKVTPGTVEMVDNGADDVLFHAEYTLSLWELSDPVNPFNCCRLFGDMNTSLNGKLMIAVMLPLVPMLPGPRPIFCLTGPIRSGKTTVAYGEFRIFGLPVRELTVKDNNEDDFWINANMGGLLMIDNVDSPVKWLADTLARASTGGSSTRRKLYTNDGNITLASRSWNMITSANPEFGADSALADRLIVIRFGEPRLDTDSGPLFEEIARHRNGILSWIVRHISMILVDNEPVPKNINLRHPDFGALAYKVGRAFGFSEEVLCALRGVESDKALFCVQNDVIGSALLNYVEKHGCLSGNAESILNALKTSGFLDDSKGYWTRTRTGKRLAKLKPHLSQCIGYSTAAVNGKTVHSFSIRQVGVVGDPGGISRKLQYFLSYGSFAETPPASPTSPTSEAP